MKVLYWVVVLVAGYLLGSLSFSIILSRLIGRDIRNSLSRIDNCEIANEEKIIRAGEKQLNSIKAIIDAGAYDKLPEKLKTVAEVRQKYPESSLLELCDYHQKMFGGTISKSGMKHRLNKLETIALNLEEKA